MYIASTVYFCPSMRTARLFVPDFDKTEFFLKLRIAHDFVPQRPSPSRDYLNHRLHSTHQVQHETARFAMLLPGKVRPPGPPAALR